MLIVLDSGPLGILSNPTPEGAGHFAQKWAKVHISSGSQLVGPEIADYEVRRELVRAAKSRGLDRLDQPCDGQAVVVATTNVAHLERYVQAKVWDQI